MTIIKTMYIHVFRIIIALFAFFVLLSPSLNALAQTAEQNTANRYLQAGDASLKAKDYRSAAEAFEQALRYYDSSENAHLGLAISYFHLREDRLSERELARVVELNPRQAMAHQLLGELAYRRDDLETAASHWQKAVELDPANAAVKARLERIQREHRTEKDFNRDVTSHFLIKYEGREKIEAGRIVLRILEDAYGEIGRALSYYPSLEIQVILYSDRQFQEVTDAPGWSSGVFDGKIRIPIGGIEQESPGLRRLLFHEYTHAAVRSLTPRVPTWLNEGLAQYFEGRQMSSSQREGLRHLAQTE
ncbi:MAG TPA: tetratricopeptide repeat protein, partial [Nitrospirota bacterium]|nr:tetratricopeptide repeat protein [Nitrospirota bacterium]